MTGFLHSALRAKWLRGALIALLLAAQHGALTHALTHAGWLAQGKVAVHASVQDGHHPVEHAVELCAFDLVYNQVLGGVHAGHALVFAAAEHALVVTATFAVRNPATAVPYDSRGPPAIS
jgi:hypothetical protein